MIEQGQIIIHGRNMIKTKGPSSMGEMRRERIAVAIPSFHAHLFWLLNPYAEASQVRTKGTGARMRGLTTKSESKKMVKIATTPSAADNSSHQTMNNSPAGIAAFKAEKESWDPKH